MNVHNMTVAKKIDITEKVNFDLMFLISNLFNHPNFNFPAGNISVPGNVGVISGVPGSFHPEKAGARIVEIRGRLSW